MYAAAVVAVAGLAGYVDWAPVAPLAYGGAGYGVTGYVPPLAEYAPALVEYALDALLGMLTVGGATGAVEL